MLRTKHVSVDVKGSIYRNVSLVVKEKYIGPVGLALNLYFFVF